MKEKPIIFSAPMVRAIIDGRKTQTRRIVKPQPSEDWTPHSWGDVHKMVNGEPDEDKVIGWGPCNHDGDEAHVCRFGPLGTRLYVRETWGYKSFEDAQKQAVSYRADTEGTRQHDKLRWRPSIHMPRRFSRLTLLVKSVRVERVQDITHADAIAEGVAYDVSKPDGTPLPRFAQLWDSIHGPGAWEANQWCWRVEFERVKP